MFQLHAAYPTYQGYGNPVNQMYHCSRCQLTIPMLRAEVHAAHCAPPSAQCSKCGSLQHSSSHCQWTCRPCSYCKERVDSEDLFNHQIECAKRKRTCAVCRRQIPVSEYGAHVPKCHRVNVVDPGSTPPVSKPPGRWSNAQGAASPGVPGPCATGRRPGDQRVEDAGRKESSANPARHSPTGIRPRSPTARTPATIHRGLLRESNGHQHEYPSSSLLANRTSPPRVSGYHRDSSVRRDSTRDDVGRVGAAGMFRGTSSTPMPPHHQGLELHRGRSVTELHAPKSARRSPMPISGFAGRSISPPRSPPPNSRAAASTAFPLSARGHGTVRRDVRGTRLSSGVEDAGYTGHGTANRLSPRMAERHVLGYGPREASRISGGRLQSWRQ
mmetsp:Transcript_28538/g.68637  ORF Transcript_28538/g.68637 Transcript_28538/m.68637 type:complete len:385 (-) Transcript_28538:249-1403(-)